MKEVILIVSGIILLSALAAWSLIYYLTYAVRSQILGATIWHGRTDTNAVALTFDDGPGKDTPALLDVLKKHQVKATFFLIGRKVKNYPHIARRIVEEGHEIGNHSQTHRILLYCSAKRIGYEIHRAQKIITAITGIAPRIMRPPCGVRTPAYFREAKKIGLRTIQWNVAGFDWKKRTAEKIARTVLAKAESGSIILLHDSDHRESGSRKATVEAIPLILEGLQKKNLQIVPLETLCQNYEENFVPANLIGKAVNGEEQI